MKVESAALTDIGKKRLQNQDAFLVDDDLGLYIVCDGMGGHAAGDVASTNATKMTAETLRDLRNQIHQELGAPGGHFKVAQHAAEAVRITCQLVHDMATHNPRFAGMGTTLTMLLIVGEKGILAHVGDSRLYLLRASSLHQLTTDHTLANELIQTGRIAEDSDEAARYHHVLTRSVGHHESVDVETLLFDLIPNDRLLLCSDGLSNYFPDDSEIAVELGATNIHQISQRLVQLANARGGKDNITCVVVRIADESAELSEQTQRILDILEETFLCRGLSLSRRMRLANLGHIREFAANQIIIADEDERDGMYVVVSGSCRVQNPSGRIVDVPVGGCFGETALVRGGPFRIRARALHPVTLMHISRSDFQAMVDRVPRLGRRLLDNLLGHISLQYDDLLSDGAELPETEVEIRRPDDDS